MRESDAMKVGNRNQYAMWSTIGLYSTYGTNLIC